MNNSFQLFISLYLLCTISAPAQEEIASEVLEVKRFKSSVVLPLVDNEKNIHLFAIANINSTEKELFHITYNAKTKEVSQKAYEKPSELSLGESVGIAVGPSNTINIYFHKKPKGKFDLLSVDKTGKIEHQEFDLKIKKEKLIQYFSHNNKFMMLTVNRNQSVLNLYEFDGNSYQKKSFDLSNERFYSDDSKIVPLSEILIKDQISTISNELSNKAIDFGNRIKIYPRGDNITITLNNNDNGTRIINLDKKSNSYEADYVPIPTREFAESSAISIRTNSFITEDKIYSLIISSDLLAIDIKNLESKEVLKVLKIDPDQEVDVKKKKETTIPILGPLSVETSRTKYKTRSAKSFFKDMKYASYAGLFVEPYMENILLKIGCYTPPSGNTAPGMMVMMNPGSVDASMDAYGNVSITSSAPVYYPTYFNTSTVSSSKEFEKHILLSTETYDLMGEAIYIDIYNILDEIKEGQEDIRLESLIKYDNYFVYGYYNKKTDLYKLVKIIL